MKNKELTQELLKELLHYNPGTGIFTWNKTGTGRKKDKTAGWKTHQGYISVDINSQPYQCHRLAWLYVYGVWPKDQIDHIDNIRHHNWISNLREATNTQNQQNLKKANITNKSCGLLGVSFNKNSRLYTSQITINRQRIHL